MNDNPVKSVGGVESLSAKARGKTLASLLHDGPVWLFVPLQVPAASGTK